MSLLQNYILVNKCVKGVNGTTVKSIYFKNNLIPHKLVLNKCSKLEFYYRGDVYLDLTGHSSSRYNYLVLQEISI